MNSVERNLLNRFAAPQFTERTGKEELSALTSGSKNVLILAEDFIHFRSLITGNRFLYSNDLIMADMLSETDADHIPRFYL